MVENEKRLLRELESESVKVMLSRAESEKSECNEEELAK
jgi:hypothetical protein